MVLLEGLSGGAEVSLEVVVGRGDDLAALLRRDELLPLVTAATFVAELVAGQEFGDEAGCGGGDGGGYGGGGRDGGGGGGGGGGRSFDSRRGLEFRLELGVAKTSGVGAALERVLQLGEEFGVGDDQLAVNLQGFELRQGRDFRARAGI